MATQMRKEVKVTITAKKDENNQVILDKNGKPVVFTQNLNSDGTPKLDSKGRPFGYIRVENPEVASLGFAYNGDNVKRGASALISMTVEAFKKNEKHYAAGTEHDGRVRIMETTESGLPGYKAKMAGSGANALPCLLDGAQIFRKTEFDSTGKLEDVLVAHNNVIVGSTVAQRTESLNG